MIGKLINCHGSKRIAQDFAKLATILNATDCITVLKVYKPYSDEKFSKILRI